MLVNLPNGKTVDMSFDDYLRIGIDDYQYLMSHNYGADMEDPFFASIIHKRGVDRDDEEDEEEDDDGLREVEM